MGASHDRVTKRREARYYAASDDDDLRLESVCEIVERDGNALGDTLYEFQGRLVAVGGGEVNAG